MVKQQTDQVHQQNSALVLLSDGLMETAYPYTDETCL